MAGSTVGLILGGALLLLFELLGSTTGVIAALVLVAVSAFVLAVAAGMYARETGCSYPRAVWRGVVTGVRAFGFAF